MPMPQGSKCLTRGPVLLALLSLIAFLPAIHAQQPSPNAQDQHIVSPDQLQQQLEASSATRQKNIDSLTQFMSTPLARQAMESAHIDPVQVKTAIPQLSDAEMASLSARAAQAQSDFSAGFLGIGWFLLIILLLVLIIVLAVR